MMSICCLNTLAEKHSSVSLIQHFHLLLSLHIQTQGYVFILVQKYLLGVSWVARWCDGYTISSQQSLYVLTVSVEFLLSGFLPQSEPPDAC